MRLGLESGCHSKEVVDIERNAENGKPLAREVGQRMLNPPREGIEVDDTDSGVVHDRQHIGRFHALAEPSAVIRRCTDNDLHPSNLAARRFSFSGSARTAPFHMIRIVRFRLHET
jgi:hypothetical protein